MIMGIFGGGFHLRQFSESVEYLQELGALDKYLDRVFFVAMAGELWGISPIY